MKPSIAFFDFDGTLTSKDTLLENIRYQKGTAGFYAGFLLHAPFLLAYKLGIISNQLAKEKILRHFFGNEPLASFQADCDRFAAECLPQLLRPGAGAELARLRAQGTKIVIVSASPENWIRPWTETQGFELIATRLEIKAGKLTGKIEGKNCYGEEKVTRIRERFDLSAFSEVYCYGDSSGDRPMLSLANFAFYKPFRQ